MYEASARACSAARRVLASPRVGEALIDQLSGVFARDSRPLQEALMSYFPRTLLDRYEQEFIAGTVDSLALVTWRLRPEATAIPLLSPNDCDRPRLLAESAELSLDLQLLREIGVE